MSWAASAALHLPDGPAAQRRDAELARLFDSLGWIHGYDALAESPQHEALGHDTAVQHIERRILRSRQ